LYKLTALPDSIAGLRGSTSKEEGGKGGRGGEGEE